MEAHSTDAVICFRTGPVQGGHILLVAACARVPDHLSNRAVREYAIIFPDNRPFIGFRIKDTAPNGVDPIVRNAREEVLRLLQVSKQALLSWARTNDSESIGDLREAIKEGVEIDQQKLLQMKDLGLIGECFYSIGNLSEAYPLRQLVAVVDNSRKAFHVVEEFSGAVEPVELLEK